MTELAHFPADADPDRVHERLLADGAVILDGVLTPDEADAIRAELDPWVQATAPGRDGSADFTEMTALRDGADVRLNCHPDNFVCPISITGLVTLLIIAPV
ncbi:MAG: hypothetical protein ACK54Q_04105 [Alphaproteobacteria bacterium]|uniref:hypothetical protein n=1 Tax=Phenylobacterium sp. TaxID=1871053 RepID=UPI0025EB66C2|nr:hypothetical protein [Phenylobacterium sp.]MCA3728042.1 hypothetical protein [Phenylobacterium sp.]MCA6242618.1 hypothetical protein [Phenylobacterium sp.]